MPDFELERSHRPPVAGVDEAGRGPLAGPVVAAAAILNPNHMPDGLDDSKKLSAARRAKLFAALSDCAETSIGIATVAEIDHLNILQATFLAMTRAVAGLSRPPVHLLIDGPYLPAGIGPATAVVKGDGRSLSIAAASIIAKVTRDRIMAELARHHPGYGWEHNAGYGTRAHRAAIFDLGVTRHHRRSFAPVRNILIKDSVINN